MNPSPRLTVERLSLRHDAMGDTEARRLAALVGAALARHPMASSMQGALDHLLVEVPAVSGETTERLAERVAATILSRAAAEVDRR